jgi:membrane-bound metal-dependent hydrolase YbcI (DUF457 family)
VDNVTHTLIGLSLAKAGLGKKTALAVPALLIGANLPDAEILWQLGRGSYHDVHRGVSHTPVGIIGLSLCLAGALWLYYRFRSSGTARVPALMPLWGLSLAGMMTHPAFDFLNDYGIRPLLPFSSARVYGDLLTILDPWIWLILGCALAPLARSNRGRAAWMVLGLLGLVIVILGWSPVTALFWIAACAVSMGVASMLSNWGFLPARVALLVLALYLGVLAAARQVVVVKAHSAGPELVTGPLERIDVIPGRPQSLLRWTVILQAPDRYYIADAGLGDWHRQPPRFEMVLKNLEDPYFRDSLADPRMADFVRFARFPVVTVESAPKGMAVLLRDLRYSRNREGGFGTVRVVVPSLPSRQNSVR